jgi:cytochrome c oxidase subunit 2
LFGSKRELKDGSTVIADEGYIKDSIQYPGAKVALGFNANMPSYRDLMDEQQLQDITNYIKALR